MTDYTDILELPRGTRESWFFDVKEAASPYGTVDLTGCTITMYIRRSWKEAVWLEKTLTLYDAENGVAELTFEKVDTVSLDADSEHKFVFDVLILTPASATEPLQVGRGKLIVTHSSVEA